MSPALLISALVALLPALGRADDCVSSAPEAVLDATRPQVHSHTFTVTGPRTAEESAVIGRDLTVHVSRAGCAHFSLVYSFDVTAVKPLTNTRAWLRVASEVMRRIAKAETAGFASMLAKAMEEQARAGDYHFGEPITITEGYASAALEVTTGEDRRAIVRVSYGVIL